MNSYFVFKLKPKVKYKINIIVVQKLWEANT